jgi:serine protease Do
MRYRTFVMLAAVCAATSLTCALTPAARLPEDAQPADTKGQLAYARALSDAFQHAAEVIGPSVVHITQINRVLVRRSFFDPGEARFQPTGLGSGVIITPDGYILTNNHVIAEAERLTVKLSDQRELPARVVGADPAADLAVLKIDAVGLPAATFADSDELHVGEWVLAVGSPFGFDNTVTAGIVSAKGRVGLAAQTDERYEEFIQTDAAINPGNSGGPLVTLEGRVVGINNQIATRSGGSVGLGFAIPSTIAQPVAEALMKNGRVERGWLGIMMNDLTPDAAKVAGLTSTQGVVVGGVVPGGPGERAGIKAGDIVTRFNGRPVGSSNRLKNAIAFTPPGSRAEIEVVRSGRLNRITVTLTDKTTGEAAAAGGKAYRDLGLAVRSLTADLARSLSYPGDIVGVVVTQVDPGGPADQAQLRAQDVIVGVNGQDIANAEQFDQAMQQADPARPIRLNVVGVRSDGFMLAWRKGFLDLIPRR